MKVFDLYAKYYNLLYAEKNYREEINYVLALLGKHSVGSINSILDLGCGTGRHDLELAEQGKNVCGVDMSPGMIESARKIGDVRMEFYCEDIRNFRIDKHFDAVLSLFHVASYMTTYADLKAYLNTAACHLPSGGLFVFDFWHGPGVLSDPPEVRVKQLQNEDIEVLRNAKPVHLTGKSIVEVHYELNIREKHSGENHVIEEQHNMRYWFLNELEYFANEIGFDLKTASKWMSEEELTLDTWYGVVVLEKR